MARRESVVIIDPSQEHLHEISTHVSALGYMPVTSSSVDHALSSSVLNNVSLILIDLNIPGVKGFEGVTAVRNVDTSVPVIAMAARDGTRGHYPLLRGARGAGADAVIEKPFNAEVLAEVFDLAKDRCGCPKPSVMIIDDSRTTGKAIKGLLAKAGYDAHAYIDAEGLLTTHRILNVDVLLTDIFLPGKSGLEIIQECHQTWPGLRVVAMSAGFKDMASEKTLKAATAVGAVAAIAKPFNEDEIDALLTRITANMTGRR